MSVPASIFAVPFFVFSGCFENSTTDKNFASNAINLKTISKILEDPKEENLQIFDDFIREIDLEKEKEANLSAGQITIKGGEGEENKPYSSLDEYVNSLKGNITIEVSANPTHILTILDKTVSPEVKYQFKIDNTTTVADIVAKTPNKNGEPLLYIDYGGIPSLTPTGASRFSTNGEDSSVLPPEATFVVSNDEGYPYIASSTNGQYIMNAPVEL